jgi:hypothetical protein
MESGGTIKTGISCVIIGGDARSRSARSMMLRVPLRVLEPLIAVTVPASETNLVLYGSRRKSPVVVPGSAN